jgi:translation elongation factor EF-Ts
MMLSGLPDSLACSTKIAFSLSRISADNSSAEIHSIEAFLMQTMENGDSLEKAREDIVASTGENVTIRRVTTVHANDGVIGIYKHGERIAVLTLLDGGDEDLAKDIAMHIAASKPECISADELSADILEREKAILPSPTSKRTNDLIVAPFDLTKAPTVVSGSFTNACPESVTSLINFFIRPLLRKKRKILLMK